MREALRGYSSYVSPFTAGDLDLFWGFVLGLCFLVLFGCWFGFCCFPRFRDQSSCFT